jgi:hypothetical protein
MELSHFEGSPCSLVRRSVPPFLVQQFLNFSRAVGLGVVQVAYGEKILSMLGDELLSWNGEEMHLYEDSFVKFWFVDIFNFRESIIPSRRMLLTHTHTVRFIPSWFPGANFRCK